LIEQPRHQNLKFQPLFSSFIPSALEVLQMYKDKRRNPRFECSGIAAVQVNPLEPPYPARIADLSVEGCLIVLDKPKRLTLNIMVELIFNVNHLPFRVRAQVRAVRSDTTVGFQFHQVSQRTCLQIEDLIDELRETAAKRAKAKLMREAMGLA
jgi:c-di-GMP-binding flagellar brake protein YcgR